MNSPGNPPTMSLKSLPRRSCCLPFSKSSLCSFSPITLRCAADATWTSRAIWRNPSLSNSRENFLRGEESRKIEFHVCHAPYLPEICITPRGCNAVRADHRVGPIRTTDWQGEDCAGQDRRSSEVPGAGGG